jgi:hypothetical protein
MNQEIYVSTDVEADGPIPGPYSMLSFASAAYTAEKELIGTFSANLHTLSDAIADPDTMAWWQTQPEAWQACRENLRDPAEAMGAYYHWLDKLPGKLVFVAYPVTYDFMFVYWYLMRFVGSSPFKHHGLDIRSYAMAVLKTGYKNSGKNRFPKHWFDDLPHTHLALDDAIEQGAIFCNMLQANTETRGDARH